MIVVQKKISNDLMLFSTAYFYITLGFLRVKMTERVQKQQQKQVSLSDHSIISSAFILLIKVLVKESKQKMLPFPVKIAHNLPNSIFFSRKTIIEKRDMRMIP